MDEGPERRGVGMVDDTPDASELCPNCGRRGERRKCKLVCTNPRCCTHIILACID